MNFRKIRESFIIMLIFLQKLSFNVRFNFLEILLLSTLESFMKLLLLPKYSHEILRIYTRTLKNRPTRTYI